MHMQEDKDKGTKVWVSERWDDEYSLRFLSCPHVFFRESTKREIAITPMDTVDDVVENFAFGYAATFYRSPRLWLEIFSTLLLLAIASTTVLTFINFISGKPATFPPFLLSSIVLGCSCAFAYHNLRPSEPTEVEKVFNVKNFYLDSSRTTAFDALVDDEILDALIGNDDFIHEMAMMNYATSRKRAELIVQNATEEEFLCKQLEFDIMRYEKTK